MEWHSLEYYSCALQCSNGPQVDNYTALTALNTGAAAGAEGFHKG